MQFKIQVVAVGLDGNEVVHEITTVERDTLQPETLGLSLAEGKASSAAFRRSWSSSRPATI